MEKYEKARSVCRWITAALFIGVGVQHFTDPATFVLIMPPYLPLHLELVYLSGVFEIAGGVGLLVVRTRVAAAWGLLALLVAVFPANVHMLVNEVYLPDMPRWRALLWARMPVQLVFAAMVLFGGGIWPRARAVPEPGAAQ